MAGCQCWGKASVSVAHLTYTRVWINQGPLHGGQEAAQVLCQLLPADVVQQLFEAIADALPSARLLRGHALLQDGYDVDQHAVAHLAHQLSQTPARHLLPLLTCTPEGVLFC